LGGRHVPCGLGLPGGVRDLVGERVGGDRHLLWLTFQFQNLIRSTTTQAYSAASTSGGFANIDLYRKRPTTVRTAIEIINATNKYRTNGSTRTGKSPFAQDCVVELGGLEPSTKRLLSRDGRSTVQPFCQHRPPPHEKDAVSPTNIAATEADMTWRPSGSSASTHR
jgi:hypothetical protein